MLCGQINLSNIRSPSACFCSRGTVGWCYLTLRGPRKGPRFFEMVTTAGNRPLQQPVYRLVGTAPAFPIPWAAPDTVDAGMRPKVIQTSSPRNHALPLSMVQGSGGNSLPFLKVRT